MNNLTIVLPTYNEAANLEPMIEALLALPLEHRLRILIVDDDSPDGTGRIADALAIAHPGIVGVIHRPRKAGLGAAYLAGFRRALDDGADLVLQLDCDFSHRPEDIAALLDAIGDADVVLGSRFCPGGTLGATWGKARRVLSRVANGTYIRWSLGLPVHDATGGFRLWRREALEAIDPWQRLTQGGYGFQVEMAYMAHRLGLRIVETPIHFPDRTAGKSKMSTRIVAEAALNVPLLRDEHADLRPKGQRGRGFTVPGVRQRTRSRILALLALALLVRLVAMAQLPLIPEEAYYWMYAQQLSLSYFDHPPMVAWVIGLGTTIFGHTEFGVRFVGQALMLASALLLYRFGADWFGRAAGLISAILLLALPAFYSAGFIATMDAPLLFFWTLGLVGVTNALKHRRASGWYLAGAALGGAMLSKYTGVFFAGGTVLAVLAHGPWRRQFLSPHPYLALVLAGLIFSPVIYWNWMQDWASFRFQFIDRFSQAPLSVGSVLGFVGINLLVLTPLLWWRLLAEAPRLARRSRFLQPRWVLAWAFALPLLGVMAIKSLHHDIHLNWTMPAILSLLPAVSHLFLLRVRLARTNAQKLWWSRQITWTAGASAAMMIGTCAFLIVAQAHHGPVSAFGPWRELAGVIEEYEEVLEYQSGQEPIVVGMDKYRLASVLAFYRGPMETHKKSVEFTTSQWLVGGDGLGYAYWGNLEFWRGRDCIVVADARHADLLDDLRPYFQTVEAIQEPRLNKLGRKRYQIAIGRSFVPGPGTGTPASPAHTSTNPAAMVVARGSSPDPSSSN